MPPAREAILLIAEDDPEDRILAERAIQASPPTWELHVVENGQELMDYLDCTGRAASGRPLPALILLDLNMPIKDGREVLVELKGNERFRAIPVVVLTTSSSPHDIQESYRLGANS